MKEIEYIEDYNSDYKINWSGPDKKYSTYEIEGIVSTFRDKYEQKIKDLEGELHRLHRRNHLLEEENYDLMLTHCDLQYQVGTLNEKLKEVKSAFDKVKLLTKKAGTRVANTIAKLKVKIEALQKFTRFDVMIIDEE